MYARADLHSHRVCARKGLRSRAGPIIIAGRYGYPSVIDSADDDDPSIDAFTADGINYIEEMVAERARS